MKRIWPLAALGVGAYIAFLLITLPASVVMAQLEPLGVHAAGVTGTAWNGRAQLLQVGNVQLGSAEWDLDILPLFLAQLQADVKLTRPDGFAQTELLAHPGGSIDLRELTASLPIAALPAAMVRGSWSGTVNLRFAELTLEDGWPSSAQGTIEVLELTGPAHRPANMGSYRATFPAEAGGAASEALTGSIVDLGGPLQITGAVQLRPDRSYLVDGLVAPRPEAPRDIARALEFLGAPDDEGRRPFALEGTL